MWVSRRDAGVFDRKSGKLTDELLMLSDEREELVQCAVAAEKEGDFQSHALTDAYRALRTAKRNFTMFQVHVRQGEHSDEDVQKLARFQAEVDLLERRAEDLDDANLACSKKVSDLRGKTARQGEYMAEVQRVFDWVKGWESRAAKTLEMLNAPRPVFHQWTAAPPSKAAVYEINVHPCTVCGG